MPSTMRLMAAAAAVLPLAGCHAYRPATLAEVPMDEPVRVSVTPVAAVRLDSLAGPGHDRPFPALYLGAADDRVVLGVPLAQLRPGTNTRAVQVRVEVAAAEVTAVEARELSTGRTLLAAFGGIAAAVGAWTLFR